MTGTPIVSAEAKSTSLRALQRQLVELMPDGMSPGMAGEGPPRKHINYASTNPGNSII